MSHLKQAERDEGEYWQVITSKFVFGPIGIKNEEKKSLQWSSVWVRTDDVRDSRRRLSHQQPSRPRTKINDKVGRRNGRRFEHLRRFFFEFSSCFCFLLSSLQFGKIRHREELHPAYHQLHVTAIFFATFNRTPCVEASARRGFLSGKTIGRNIFLREILLRQRKTTPTRSTLYLCS